MEIDITNFITDCEPFMFSASAMEMGQNAGKITWANAVDEAGRAPLLTTEAQLDAARAWARDFGAWDDEEITAWSADEVNALLIQYIAGNLREIETLCMGDDGEIDWAKVEQLEQAGTISGNIYRGDIAGSEGFDRVFFYMGS